MNLAVKPPSVLCQPAETTRFWYGSRIDVKGLPDLRFRGPRCRLWQLDRVICQSILEWSQAGDTVWLPLYKSVTFVYTDIIRRQRLWSYDLTALYKCIIIIIIISVHSVHHVACNIVSLLRVLSMYAMHVTAVFCNFVRMIQDWRPECRNALVSAAATLLYVNCDPDWFTDTKSDEFAPYEKRVMELLKISKDKRALDFFFPQLLTVFSRLLYLVYTCNWEINMFNILCSMITPEMLDMLEMTTVFAKYPENGRINKPAVTKPPPKPCFPIRVCWCAVKKLLTHSLVDDLEEYTVSQKKSANFETV